jgi:hypothetical protein
MVARPGAGRHHRGLGHAVTLDAQFASSQRARMKVKPPTGRIGSEADAQVVAGLWMISCIDENPGVIYHSVASRLNANEQEVEKVVKNWRELFRPGINPKDAHERRDELISKFREEKGLTREELKKKLDTGYRLEDWCFRSQFRRSLSDPKSPPDEIRLGLDYIETHRKTYLEFAEEVRQRRVYRAPLRAIWVTLILGALALGVNGLVGALNFYAATKANSLKAREIDLKSAELASKQQEVAKPTSPTTPSPAAPSPAPSAR